MILVLTMFCLDFAIAFVAHYQIHKHFPGVAERESDEAIKQFSTGALAGLVAALALYPFDILRQSVVEKGKTSFAYSTIPFMSVYLGMNSMLVQANRRQQGDLCSSNGNASTLASRYTMALISTAAATIVQIPFDKAKLSMAGGNMGYAMAMSALRVPLGAALLVAYNEIHAKNLSRR